MLTYNAFLYTERNNRGLSRRKMAKLLKIFPYSYSMIEKGYFKPTKRQVKKISAALDIDYSEYLVGEPSYPSELPEKKRNKVVAFFYKILGHLAFKIVFAVLSGASVAFMISSFIVQNNFENNIRSYYGEEYLTFVDNLKTNGVIHLSATSTLMSPEYYIKETEENGDTKYISIIGKYEDEYVSTMTFTATYRDDKSRLIYSIIRASEEGQPDEINAKYSEYDTCITVTTVIKDGKTDIISYMDEKGYKDYFLEDNVKFAPYFEKLSRKIKQYENDFNLLISEKDPTFAKNSSNKLQRLFSLMREGENKAIIPEAYGFLGRYFGIILSGINLFILAYSILYGTTKKGEKIYATSKLEVEVNEVKRMKSDIKFAPFIPETILEIIGIILVFIGSFRLVFYAAGFLTANSSIITSSSLGTGLMQIFMVGMFLLYFIDFDIFLDDKRVIRNIVLYTIIFFCLYGLENLLYRVMNNDSIVGDLMGMMIMPNMFGSIACYYWIMLFLFYRPSFIKKNSTLIVYRCMSVIPAAYIFVSWYLFNGYNLLFTADWPNEVKNLFNGEKIPFSILAVSYLFFLYFIRLFFTIRLGHDRARTFFNGNKFLWIKNIMVSVIILIIGLVELSLKNNPVAHKLGLGMYWNILFLIPLLLFYHPHKGPRNIILDWTTLFFYILAISLSYIAVIIMVLVKLFA